jgi:hypothetical protein
MKEVLNVIVCHLTLEQYTVFNFPLNNYDEMTPQHLRSLQEYADLYDRYLATAPLLKKKETLLKKVFAIETYTLFFLNDLIIMATIAHNRTSKNVSEICQHIYDDVLADISSHFIFP